MEPKNSDSLPGSVNPASLSPNSSSTTTPVKEASKKRKFAQYCESKPFTFVVGAEKKEFTIHKAALAEHSITLATLVNGPMQEAQENVAYCPDIDPDTFALFAQFVYTGAYETCRGFNNIRVAIKNGKIADSLISGAKLFILADYYGMTALSKKSQFNILQILSRVYQQFKPEAPKEMRCASAQAMTAFISFCFDSNKQRPQALKTLAIDWIIESAPYLGKAEELLALTDSSLELAAALCRGLLKIPAI